MATQVVLPLLETDLFTVMKAVADGKLGELDVKFSSGSACCVVMASNGYPQSYKKGFAIDIPADVADDVYVAGATLKNGELVTSGGRVLGVTSVADSLADAIEASYEKVGKIAFEGAYYRHDIGKRALAAGEEK